MSADEVIDGSVAPLPLVVLGAGGHAKTVITALRRQGARILGVATPEAGLWGGTFQGAPVLGGDDEIDRLGPAAIRLVNAVGLGVPGLRRRLFERYVARGFAFPPVVDPTAILADDVVPEAGAQVLAGAVIQSGTRIGVNTVVNTRAIIDHDGDIGAHSFIAPGAVLAGCVRVGDDALVGTGASVRPGVRIGAGAVIGVGAAAVCDIPDNAVAVGVPARPRPAG